MKHLIILFSLFLFSFQFWQCQNATSSIKDSNSTITKDSLSSQLGHGYDFIGNGKKPFPKLDSIYTEMNLDTFNFPDLSNELLEGLNHQLRLLKFQKNNKKKFGEKLISKDELETTIKVLIASQFNNTFGINSSLAAHQIWGEDERGNVHFTGYFTPVLKVKKQRDSIFQFPLYQYPKGWEGTLPTRKEIDEEGALDGRNLEIVFAKSKLDIYVMQVQGSGIVEFPNGEKKLLAYSGSNKHPYRSIGKFMIEQGYTTKEHVSLKSIQKYFLQHPEQLDSILYINPSYIFFSPKDRIAPQGAGNVPLTSNHSVAVDKNYIPLGSCLLASVPILDANRNFSHHEYRVLLAQDIGGAIKGSGHVDLYSGIGSNAKFNASNLHHYGRIWLLLPKKKLDEND